MYGYRDYPPAVSSAALYIAYNADIALSRRFRLRMTRSADSSPGVLYAACGCLALVADTTLGAVLCVADIASAETRPAEDSQGPWIAA